MKTINTLRKNNKNNWYFFKGNINNKYVEIKGFKTWLQVFRVDGIDYSNPIDQSVSDYKKHLTTILN